MVGVQVQVRFIKFFGFVLQSFSDILRYTASLNIMQYVLSVKHLQVTSNLNEFTIGNKAQYRKCLECQALPKF